MSLYIGNKKVTPIIIKETTSSNFVYIPMENNNGSIVKPLELYSWKMPEFINDVGAYGLYYSFFYQQKLENVDMTSLKSVSGSNAMGYCFSNCISLKTADLSEVESITGASSLLYCFNACTGLETIDFSGLVSVKANNALQFLCNGCSNITEIKLNNLTEVRSNNCFYRAFRNCVKLKHIYFYNLSTVTATNTFSQMLSGVTGCTVHFPTSLESVIGSWSDVTGGFAGTGTIVLFDL